MFELFSYFKIDKTSIDDKPRTNIYRRLEPTKTLQNHPGRSTTEHWRSVKLSGVIFSSVQRILMQDLGMRTVAAKFMPRLLTTCCALKEEFRNDSCFFSRSWCYGYNHEMKQQSSQWKIPSSLCPKIIAN